MTKIVSNLKWFPVLEGDRYGFQNMLALDEHSSGDTRCAQSAIGLERRLEDRSPNWSGLLGQRSQDSTECMDVCVVGREVGDSTGMQMHRDEEATGYDMMAAGYVFPLMYVEHP